MNTKINYLYRDGSNYKQYNEAVLEGEFTSEDLKLIESVQDCELFIPEQVGLHLVRIDDEITEDDHCYAELFPEDDIELTDEEPYNGDCELITWSQLMDNFRKVKETGWDEVTYAPY